MFCLFLSAFSSMASRHVEADGRSREGPTSFAGEKTVQPCARTQIQHRLARLGRCVQNRGSAPRVRAQNVRGKLFHGLFRIADALDVLHAHGHLGVRLPAAGNFAAGDLRIEFSNRAFLSGSHHPQHPVDMNEKLLPDGF